MAAAIARGWASADSRAGLDALRGLGLGPGAAPWPPRSVAFGPTPWRSSPTARDLIVLAVKPAALADVAEAIDGRADVITSVLGATTVQQLEEALPRPRSCG